MTRGQTSLSGRIFRVMLVLTVVVILVIGAAVTSLFYLSYERQAESSLSEAAQNAAQSLNDAGSAEREGLLEAQWSPTVRCTLIAADGTVVYDSLGDASTMENHADRPEVLAADEQGTSKVTRYSATLNADTLYAAVRLDDGGVIRLAETRDSLLAFTGELVLPLVIALMVALVAVFLLSHFLTRRIMAPIDDIDLSDPASNEIYEEMRPLLSRIDEQQRRLREQNSELALAQSMRRDFSSNVSHEMKTPLQVISGYAELMREDLVQPDDRRRFAGLIYDEAQSMRQLVDDVLTLSKLDETAFDASQEKPLDLLDMARDCASRLSSIAADRKVSVSVEGESTCITGMETLIDELLYNLIENAIRYNKEGGQVRVSVRSELPTALEQAQEERTLPASERGRMRAVVRVSDTGAGIPQDMQDKIFERFYRLEKSRSKETGGTGLGLAIVKHAVAYHKGTVSVESELGRGSTFTVRLPME